MRGYRLTTSFYRPVKPALQRGLESFGLKKDQEHGYVEAPYYNGLGRYELTELTSVNWRSLKIKN